MAKKSIESLKKAVAAKKAGPREKGRNRSDVVALREEQFVSELLQNGFNATEAYMKIHPRAAKKTANTSAVRYFKKEGVRKRLAEALAERRERNKLNEDFVLQRWRGLANANMADYLEKVNHEDGSFEYRQIALHDLEEWQQRNVKKMKITTRYEPSTEEGGEPTKIQQVEMELYDYQKAVDTVAKHLGMLDERGVVDIVDWAAIIRAGMERAKNGVTLPTTIDQK